MYNQNDKRKKRLTGKTWEEIYGEEKAKDLKSKASKRFKGKTYNEMYGEEKANELKKSRINSGKKGANNNWKLQYSSKNLPLYSTYYKKLTIEENPKRDIIDPNILTVLCTYCRKRFIPLLLSVQERVRCIKGSHSGECRIYCSDECKKNCSIFNRSIYQENHPKRKNISYTQEEYQTFREYVLNKDNYICQFCGEKATDVHHERPQKLEPFFSLDPDYAWSCCKKCHYKKGHKDSCSTGNLSKRVC